MIIQTGSHRAEVVPDAVGELCGRLLAAGLHSLEEQLAQVGGSRVILLDQADKQPLLDVIEAWVAEVGAERLAPTGILHLQEGLQSELTPGREWDWPPEGRGEPVGQ